MAITKRSRNLTKRDPPKRRTYDTLLERSRSTLGRHARFRPSIKDKAANQQYSRVRNRCPNLASKEKFWASRVGLEVSATLL